jgi:hypothetical protein
VDSVEMFGERAHVRMKPGHDAGVSALSEGLRAAGLETISVRPVAPSLEDIFVTRLGEAGS